MNHLPDDALNGAWNDLASSRETDTSTGIDASDRDLLRAMHASAATIQPGAAFSDQLWAELSRRPMMPSLVPTVTPSLPASTRARSGVPTMTPRLAPTSRRWNPPIATIAAALVIALIGYGALSLSGVNPSGINLNLNEVPNASAQGQGMAQSDNPVLGTWVIFADGFSSSGAILQLISFEPDGTVSVQFAFGRTGAVSGRWTMDSSKTIHYQYMALKQSDTVDANYSYGDPVLLLGVLYSGSFQVAPDQGFWQNSQLTGTLLAADQHGNPISLTESISETASPDSAIIVSPPERLEHLFARSPEMTAEQEDFFTGENHRAVDSPGLDVNAPHPGGTPTEVTVTPMPTYVLPTPTSIVVATTFLPAATDESSANPVLDPTATVRP